MDAAPVEKTKILITPNIPPPTPGDRLWGADGASFKDILDIINPLQQIPVVSTIYRLLTGDTISAASRLAGGALLGGPIGFALALANEIVQGETGRDIGENAIALIDGSKEIEFAENAVPSGAPSPTNRSAYQAYMHMQNMMG